MENRAAHPHQVFPGVPPPHPPTPPDRCIVTAAKCTKECVARACLLFWSCLLLKDFIQQQKRFSSSECQTNSSTSALIYLYNCKLFFFLSWVSHVDRHSRELVSNNDRDRNENVTKKVNSRCFKLYLAYSISFNSSNVRTFLWSWILKKLCRSSVNFS